MSKDGVRNILFEVPMSFSQQRLWFLNQLSPEDIAYNISSTLSVRGQLDIDALQHSLDSVVVRHEILRTVFSQSGDLPTQQVLESIDSSIHYIDMVDSAPHLSSAPQAEVDAMQALQDACSVVFDLSRGPLLRVTVLNIGDQRYWLNFTLHHIISDGWSMGIMIREISKHAGHATGHATAGHATGT